MDIRRTPSPLASVFAIVSMFTALPAAGCGGAGTFSEEHIDSIEYDCSQTAPCDPAFATINNAVEECVKDTSNKLDRGTEALRANYTLRFSRCSSFSGCQYFACAGNSMLYSIVNEQKLRYDCQQQTVCKIQAGMPTAPTDNDTCFKALSQTIDFASVPDKTAYDQRLARCGAFMGCDFVNCR